MKTAALLIVLAVLAGCGTSAETRQQVANSQATIIEAAGAEEAAHGPSAALRAIRRNAVSSCHAMGYEYPDPPKETP